MHINANIVTIDESGPVMIGFADDPNRPNNYVLFSYDVSEKDSGLYIEVNEQHSGGYNLVRQIQISDYALRVDLTPDGMKTLGLNSVKIDITISSRVVDWPSLVPKVVALLRQIVPVELQER